MISTSEAYKTAIVGDARRMRLRAIVDIAGPDIIMGAATYPAAVSYAKPEQLTDRDMDLTPPLVTLEHNRWLLDGSYIPVGAQGADAQIGLVTEAVSDADGFFSEPQVITQTFAGADILQSASIYFSDRPEDGVPADFTVEVLSGAVARYTKTVTSNMESAIKIGMFTVNYPTALRLTVTRWSLPYRRMRAAEFIAGSYEVWTGGELAEFNVTLQGSFTGLTLPYGTCSLRMDNLDRRFEPRNKEGIFQSVQERQGIQVLLGPDTPAGAEYVPLGVFYQCANGWKTGGNQPTMKWDLVDIIGLMNDREFIPPATLPTTLDGWAASLVSQLGTNFRSRYHVDASYAGLGLRAEASAVTRKKCGQILLWICQATQTWPRADAETGYLTIEPYWNEGNILDLDNLNSYPVISANDELALINFTLSDGTTLVIGGSNISASQTANVTNPFLHTEAQARAVAKMMLTSYGGNRIETVGRGNPSSEIGDVATVQLDRTNATTGRVMYQSFQFRNGVLQECQTKLLQAGGGFDYENRVLLTESGTWTVPDGVTTLRIAIGQGGQGGGRGTDGRLGYSGSVFDPPEDGEAGVDGYGGKIWYGTIDVDPGTVLTIAIGAGGRAATEKNRLGGVGAESSVTVGTVTFSSVNGNTFPNGYTDIVAGDSYGRSGVELPAPNSSDGGKGGEAGKAGYAHREKTDTGSRRVVDSEATEAEVGADGGSGFVLIYYDRN